MALGQADIAHWVDAYERAWRTDGTDGLADLFTADATYRDLFYGPHAGPAGLRGMFERMFREGRDYRWSMDAIVMDDRRAAAEWTFGYTATAAVPRSEGRRIRFSGMSIFELEGGRDEVNRFMRLAKGIPFSPSLGDTTTTCSHPATTSHRYVSGADKRRLGIGDGLIRLSVGVEDVAQAQTEMAKGLGA